MGSHAVRSPGCYFSVGENRRHSRGLRWRIQSLVGNFRYFGPCGAGFGRRSLVAIFQFPFRRSGDRFDCRQRPIRWGPLGSQADAGTKPQLTFTLREDRLGAIAVGAPFSLRTAKGDRIAARVTELRPLGEFATWRAARAVGDHDVNSFLVRADPIAETQELEPGMTVWLDRANGVDGIKP